MIPEKIGRYQIKSELGRGGMATVYLAYDPSFDREVAIKVLPREFLHDPQFQHRFKNEIKTIAALEHPAIVPVHDVGEEDGMPYFVMRYMTGGSLSSRIEKGKFPITDAARIIERLSSALAYAHQKGIVHRDLKPDNILFDDRNDPYITDFGVASFASSQTNITGDTAIGTPAYMSPEQAQGDKVDNRSDIYGLGVIIFQMLSGKQPYDADTPMGVAIKHITEPVPEILKTNPTLPRATDTVIKTAMAKKKEDRYPSATDLAQAFRQLADEVEGVVTNKPVAGSSNSKKTLIIGGAIALVVVLILGTIGIFALGKLFASPTPQATATVVANTIAPVTDTPNVADEKYFTEEFDTALNSNWTQFVTSGNEKEMSVNAADGALTFNLPGAEMEVYTNYTPQTYDNVRIDIKVKNQNQNPANVFVICRYQEDAGWYEFRIGSDGFYKILYRSWNIDKKGASSAKIYDGATPEILTGKNTNEYSIICKDRTLALTVNGVEVRSVVDNNFVLDGGTIAIGVGSQKRTPVELSIESVKISEP
ncbi:MAG: protein kinase [Anaerolineales bacterium]